MDKMEKALEEIKNVTPQAVMKELDDCITNMLISPDYGYQFYANVVMKMLKGFNENLPAPAGMNVVKAKFNFTVSRLFVLPTWDFNNRIGFCVHEIEHFCRLHVPRRIALLGKTPGMDLLELANIAFDCEINQNIRDIPKDCCFPETYKMPKDKTAEWYYYELLKIRKEQKQEQKGQSGKGKGKDDQKQKGSGGGPGEKQDKDEQQPGSGKQPQSQPNKGKDSKGRPKLPQPGEGTDVHEIWTELTKNADPVMVEEMTREIVNEVAKALGQGNLPGHIEELIKELNKPRKINWKEMLKRYVGTAVKTIMSRTWTRFNRRHPLIDIKGKKKEKGKTMVFVIDTSGSMSSAVINEAMAEIKHIKRLRGMVVWLIHADTQVEWVGKIEDYKKMPNKIYGRGGTDFRDAFEWPVKEKKKVDVMIFLTDGMGTYPDEAPRWPVIWLMVEGYKPEVNWGRVVNFPQELNNA